MTTLNDLRALTKDYGLSGRSKLKKYDLQKAITEVRAAGFIKRFRWLQKAVRLPSFQADVENLQNKVHRARERHHIDDEVGAAL